MSTLWFNGINPVVDLVVVRTHPEQGLQVLLIQRSDTSDAEPSKWAFPGGFVDSGAKKNDTWASGPTPETALNAAIRECAEETGLDVSLLAPHLKLVGVYRGPGRDPRETNERFTESHAFFLSLDGLMSISKSDGVVGLDDAQNATWQRWATLDTIPLAFDHATICEDVSRFLDPTWSKQRKHRWPPR
jgi:ADP-ribose pyrophosphatase YjhB (NUDIX family)